MNRHLCSSTRYSQYQYWNLEPNSPREAQSEGCFRRVSSVGTVISSFCYDSSQCSTPGSRMRPSPIGCLKQLPCPVPLTHNLGGGIKKSFGENIQVSTKLKEAQGCVGRAAAGEGPPATTPTAPTAAPHPVERWALPCLTSRGFFGSDFGACLLAVEALFNFYFNMLPEELGRRRPAPQRAVSWPPLTTLSSAHATIQGQFCLLFLAYPSWSHNRIFLNCSSLSLGPKLTCARKARNVALKWRKKKPTAFHCPS